MPDIRKPIESLSGPEAHDKEMIRLYNQGMNSRQISVEHPEWTRNFIDNRLKLMAAMGEVTLRPHGGGGKDATGAKRGPKGQFVKESKEEK